MKLEDSDPTGSDTVQEEDLGEEEEEVLEAAFQKQLKIAESKLQTRVIIRHLPPTITEERFLDIISPLPEYESYYFVPADWSLGLDATCRAYLNFKSFDDVVSFSTRFDNYTFVDNRGAEYLAMVEFAPFQGLPKNRTSRKDTKANTIENESHYQQFLERLDKQREAAQSGGEFRLDFKLEPKKDEVKLTPLLEYLANRKEKRREEGGGRDERRKRQREEERERKRLQQQSLQKQRQEQQQHKQQQQQQKQQDNQKAVDDRPQKDDKKKQRSQRRAERQARRYEEYLKRVQNNGENKTEAGKKTTFSEVEYPSVGETMGHRKDKKQTDISDAKTSKGKKAEDGQVNDAVRNFICSVATFKDVVVREHTNSESDRLENSEENKTKNNDSTSSQTGAQDSRRNSNASEIMDDKIPARKQSWTSDQEHTLHNDGERKTNIEDKQQKQRSSYNDRDRNRSNRDRNNRQRNNNEKNQNRNKNRNRNDNVKILSRQTTQENNDTPTNAATIENKPIKTDKQLENEKPSKENHEKKDDKSFEETTSTNDNINENTIQKDEKARSNEEQRRIRNKDRPSIAIYQPKAMQRSNSTNANAEDIPKTSEPDKANDNTNNKKDDLNNKRVARYSEQRYDKRPNRKERRDSCSQDK